MCVGGPHTKFRNVSPVPPVIYPPLTQPSYPFRVGKWVVIHVITWITGVKTIKQQTRVAYGWLIIGQFVAAGLAYGLQVVRPPCVRCTAPLHLRYADCGAIQVLYGFAFLLGRS